MQFYNPARRGLCCKIPPITKTSTTKAQSLYDNSFHINGAKLWNCIPKEICSKPTITSFKAALTKFLLTLQDHPPVPGIASHNSLTEVLSSGDVVQGSVEEEDGWGEDALMISS